MPKKEVLFQCNKENIMFVNVGDFMQEVECLYKGERYSVRDNGAVLRHSREGKKPRPTDNQWTFGKPNQKGYLNIGTELIHRIVATAFHGDSPTSQHIADHIDTNRNNNRPENLHWLTKLENALKNPITRKRIEIACGSIEAFIENPSLLKENEKNKDIAWMRRVSIQEAKICYEKLLEWANSDKQPSGDGKLGEWIYQSSNNTSTYEQSPEIINAITPNAVQKKWRTPCEFPYCPQEAAESPIENYANNLKVGNIFAHNDLYESKVEQFAFADKGKTLIVMTKSEGLKPYALAKITYEDNVYIHTSIQSFFTKEGAEKQFTIAQGFEWTGEDSIDDYC
jgi:hypothetical protein